MSADQRRDACVVCGQDTMQPVRRAIFPTFQGPVSGPRGVDELAEMSWRACTFCGSAQIELLPPQDVIYQAGHATGLGQAWARHHQAFASFVKREAEGAIVDIGGGSGNLALAYRDAGGRAAWTILEPNAVTVPGLPQDVRIAQGFLDSDSLLSVAPETAVLCHVLEHLPALSDAVATLHAASTLHRVILAWPVLERWTARGLAGALNFEHCTYVTLPTLKALFAAQGWTLRGEAAWPENDTAFLSFERGACARFQPVQTADTAGAIARYYDGFEAAAEQLQRAVSSHRGDAFLMPASIYTQTLLASGLDERLFVSLLDNAPQKQGLRLFGTGLQIVSPSQMLPKAKNPLVLLNGGAHTDEIIRGLRALRADVAVLNASEGPACREARAS